MQAVLPIKVHGHLRIEDDLGNVLVDKDNAIHPQNMARVIARALANEPNYFIKSIAFGNGGTDINAALDITFNPPNDGQSPDIRTWDSRLYNETYREIIDDNVQVTLGTGVGAVPSSDPGSVGVTSSELGILSQVIVRATLNKDEPTGQLISDTNPQGANFDGSFTFDEIGLFTGGVPLEATAGYFDIEVGTPADTTSQTDITNLLANGPYSFFITVNGGTRTEIIVDVNQISPVTPGVITLGDLCEAINTGVAVNVPLPNSATISITDTTDDYDSIRGHQTYGYLRFVSADTGSSSSVLIEHGLTGNSLFGSDGLGNGVDLELDPQAADPDVIQVDGQDAGEQNNTSDPNREAERMLTHVIFAPVLKTANRALNIKYTLTIAVARSNSVA